MGMDFLMGLLDKAENAMNIWIDTKTQTPHINIEFYAKKTNSICAFIRVTRVN